MSETPNMSPTQGARALLAMVEFGIEMYRERMRTEHPDENATEIQARVQAWLDSRPGAPFGDGEGVPASWPRAR